MSSGIPIAASTQPASWRRGGIGENGQTTEPGEPGVDRRGVRGSLVGDDVHVDRPGQMDRAVDDRAAEQLLPPRAMAGAEHELRGVLRRARTRRARRRRRRRQPRGTRPRCPRAACGARRGARVRRRRARRRRTTCTPSSSPWARWAMRAARRISASVPGAPVTATTTRSRVSHGLGDAVTLAVLLEADVDLVGDPQQRQLAERAEVAGAEVVGQRRRRSCPGA